MKTNNHVIDFEKFSEYDNHEYISFFSYKKYGLKGIVAIHNTTLGPATGGTRLWPYVTLESALKDVLNLSKAMSYKCALSDLPFGGGKAVIIGHTHSKSNHMLEAYGKVIDSLGGHFTTGTDVGISPKDTSIMARRSKFILGQNTSNNLKKDTSKMAALGVYYAMKTTIKKLYGQENLSGKKIAIKGTGKLGSELIRLLTEEDAQITATEIDTQKINEIIQKFPKVKFVASQQIYKTEADIFSPNALGGDINADILKKINTKAIVGGANNQLSSPDIGDQLFNRGIIYAPDYVVNAGGLINIVDELEIGGYQAERVEKRIKNIQKTLEYIYNLSEKNNLGTHAVADKLARIKISKQNI